MSARTTTQVDQGFEALTALAYREAGLVLSESKAPMIKSRLRHRMREMSIETLDEYCAFIDTKNGRSELQHMISALTTNVSGFFRERHHFDFLSEEVLPSLKEKIQKGQSVRIWSAGCSNGQEPYSIAISLIDHHARFRAGQCKILATDIDEQVLGFASKGIYEAQQINGIDDATRSRHFSLLRTNGEIRYEVSAEVKRMVTFRPLNLHANWPMRGFFDVIFCRNVVIYFSGEAQGQLWPRFRSKLTNEGVIFVGHSERISTPGFDLVAATTYSKSQDCISALSREREYRNGVT